MKILTLNTHSWLEINQIDKLTDLAHYIVNEDIDVITLQEVNQHQQFFEATSTPCFVSTSVEHPIREDNYALLLVRLLKKMGYTYHWSWIATHLGFEMYEEGLAILSKAPLQRTQALDLAPNYGFYDIQKRFALAAKIEVQGQPLWFATCHLSWWNNDGQSLFEHEFALLDRQLREIADAPAVMMGDFNNDSALRKQGYDLVLSRGWHDARASATQVLGEATVHKAIHGWDEVLSAMTLDHIFTSEPIEFKTHKVVFADNTAQAISDHSGVLASFDPLQLSHPSQAFFARTA